MIKKRISLFAISIILVFAILIGLGNYQEVSAKDKIVIGWARSFSGILAKQGETCFNPIAEMWIEEVNSRGGLYVEEYGKRLPIEVIKYDTKSDTGTMTRLMEKLMVEDKVDFIFPPISTANLFAAAPVANKHGYILMGMEGGASHLEEYMDKFPYFFSNLNYAKHQVPAMVDVLAEQGVEDAAIIYISDLHGVEYSEMAVPALEERGIEVKFCKSINMGAKDLSAVIKEANKLDVDAFITFTYPDTTILVTKQAIELGYNPRAFVTDVGSCFEFYKDMFGKDKVEGIMSLGGWNRKSTPEADEFAQKIIDRFGKDKLDWWGQIIYYSALEFFGQAIEKAGTLDQEVVRDVMANSTFETTLGSTWYENGCLAEECYPGQLAQWQDGIYEIIGPEEKATAEVIYPKPAWSE